MDVDKTQGLPFTDPCLNACLGLSRLANNKSARTLADILIMLIYISLMLCELWCDDFRRPSCMREYRDSIPESKYIF